MSASYSNLSKSQILDYLIEIREEHTTLNYVFLVFYPFLRKQIL